MASWSAPRLVWRAGERTAGRVGRAGEAYACMASCPLGGQAVRRPVAGLPGGGPDGPEARPPVIDGVRAGGQEARLVVRQPGSLPQARQPGLGQAVGQARKLSALAGVGFSFSLSPALSLAPSRSPTLSLSRGDEAQVPCQGVGFPGTGYRGTSLIRKRAPLEPYSRTMPKAIWWS